MLYFDITKRLLLLRTKLWLFIVLEEGYCQHLVNTVSTSLQVIFWYSLKNYLYKGNKFRLSLKLRYDISCLETMEIVLNASLARPWTCSGYIRMCSGCALCSAVIKNQVVFCNYVSLTHFKQNNMKIIKRRVTVF